MEREISKKVLLRAMVDRPALIKKVTNPSEEFILSAIKQNPNAIYHIEDELKTKKVCESLLRSEDMCWMKTIPADMFHQLDIDLLKSVLKKSYGLYLKIPNPTIEMAKVGWNTTEAWDGLEKKYQTEEVAEAWIIQGQGSRVPDPVWTEKLADIAKEKGRNPWQIFHCLPSRFYTEERLLKLLVRSNEEEEGNFTSFFTLDSDLAKKIPWTRPLMDAVILLQASNIEFMPNKLLTKEDLKEYPQHITFETLPKKFKEDREVQIAMFYYISKVTLYKKKGIPLYEKEFQVEAAGAYLRNLKVLKGLEVKIFWEDILTKYPKAIAYLDKKEQTEELLEIFFSSSDTKTIDYNFKYINLSRITKGHVPLLFGVTDPELLSLIERKYKGTAVKKVEIIDPIKINITPKELNELNKKYLED